MTTNPHPITVVAEELPERPKPSVEAILDPDGKYQYRHKDGTPY